MKTVIITLLGAGMLALVGVGLPSAWSSIDEDDEHDHLTEKHRMSVGVAAVTHPGYKDECGSCHFAYPPGLLPAHSWSKIMNTLDDHFGDNAEVDETARVELTQYLQQNSADNVNYRRSRAIMRSLAEDPPLRITKTSYFQHEHDEIPARLVKDNPKVGSFSQCDTCHQRAENGLFSESDIHIPGYGQWDD